MAIRVLQHGPVIAKTNISAGESHASTMMTLRGMYQGAIISDDFIERPGEVSYAMAVLREGHPTTPSVLPNPSGKIFVYVEHEGLATPVYDFAMGSLVPANQTRYDPVALTAEEARLFTYYGEEQCDVRHLDNLPPEKRMLMQPEEWENLQNYILGMLPIIPPNSEPIMSQRINQVLALRSLFTFNANERQIPLVPGTNPDLDDRVLVLGQFQSDKNETHLPIAVCARR